MTTDTEQALIDAWRVAEQAWKADPANRDKERALNRAADELRRWRRTHTPEGIAYANEPKTYRDDTGDNAP